MKSKLSFFLLLIVIASCLQRPLVVNALSGAPAPCVAGHTAAKFGFWTWPANSQVNVYLRQPDFNDADLNAVRISVQNWDHAAVENGSNVHFTVRGLTHETKTGRGDMTLIHDEVFDTKLRHLALLQAHSLKMNKLIDYAVVIVDFKVRNAEVLTNVMAHEIGHSLGLMDCTGCNSLSTAMGLMKTAEDSNGIDGPTACDKVVVAAAYRELALRVKSATDALSFNRSVVDEGEEPEMDDTPIIDRP